MTDIPRSEAKNTWISVDEALPPDFKRCCVLTRNEIGSTTLTIGAYCRRDENEWKWVYVDHKSMLYMTTIKSEVMYWCNSIPELPEGYAP